MTNDMTTDATNDPTATEIVVIRHGETDWNVERRLQGHLDIGLNVRGRQQAAALADALQDENFAAIVSSDLARAIDTAKAIAAVHGLQLETVDGLRERCFGALEGLRHDEIRMRLPDAYAAWKSRDVEACYPPGKHAAESLRAFHARVVSTIDGLAGRFAGQKIAVVTHGGVLDSIYRAATGLELSKPRPVEVPNAGVNRVCWERGRIHVRSWGDVGHLTRPALDELE